MEPHGHWESIRRRIGWRPDIEEQAVLVHLKLEIRMRVEFFLIKSLVIAVELGAHLSKRVGPLNALPGFRFSRRRKAQLTYWWFGVAYTFEHGVPILLYTGYFPVLCCDHSYPHGVSPFPASWPKRYS